MMGVRFVVDRCEEWEGIIVKFFFEYGCLVVYLFFGFCCC